MKPIVSDTILRDAVIKELDDDPEVAAKHISVTAIDGAITLAGHVMTIHEKHVAVRAAERVDAVRAVADDIEVRACGVPKLVSCLQIANVSGRAPNLCSPHG